MPPDDPASRFVAQLAAHKKILFKVARLYCANPADREELTQDIVIQLWRSFDRFDGRERFPQCRCDHFFDEHMFPGGGGPGDDVLVKAGRSGDYDRIDGRIVEQRVEIRLDVPGGVERAPGVKDHALITQFVAAVRGAATSPTERLP